MDNIERLNNARNEALYIKEKIKELKILLEKYSDEYQVGIMHGEVVYAGIPDEYLKVVKGNGSNLEYIQEIFEVIVSWIDEVSQAGWSNQENGVCSIFEDLL